MVSVASISSGESLRHFLSRALPGGKPLAEANLPALYAGPFLPALPVRPGRTRREGE